MKFTTTLLFCVCLILINGCSMKPKNVNIDGSADNDSIKSGKVIPMDSFRTKNGSLLVTLVGHGSVMFEHKGKIIHVDPYSEVADYSKLPKADLILITHEHYDHLDRNAIDSVKKADTRFIMSQACYDILEYGEVIGNGDSTVFEGIPISAVPAYNLVHKNPEGEFYHPKGRGNGYVLLFDGLRVYVAGDTENIPEMEGLRGSVDIAFFPKNLPYTMDDEMFAEAVKMVKPKYLYPYHMAEFNGTKINNLLNNKNIKILVRPMLNK